MEDPIPGYVAPPTLLSEAMATKTKKCNIEQAAKASNGGSIRVNRTKFKYQGRLVSLIGGNSLFSPFRNWLS